MYIDEYEFKKIDIKFYGFKFHLSKFRLNMK